ncbi:MAG: DUF551 domain-containing protein [Oscillospiraceae bacterium]|nr:DUF551 domain-containing protein [Oscillospiraceae bacterium]
MPNTREKLIELIQSAVDGCAIYWAGLIADHLISNGVTFQSEPLTNCQQWISVKDRLPDTIPCGAGTEYSEAVNVLTDGRKVLTAIWNGLHWICDAEFWDAEFEEITHWTPVLLPLPQPPKGE